MKNNIKITAFILACAIGFSVFYGCASCKKNEDTTIDDKPRYEESGYTLVNNGLSEYVIVLPESPNTNEYTASDELVYFLEEATGAKLSVKTEKTYTPTDNAAIISIGNTAIAKKVGVKTDGTLGNSGYIMKTVGNQLYIISDGNSLGCIYAVYDLLESTVGYRYYYTDEIYYETKSTVSLFQYDITADPSFDFRAISTWNSFLYTHEDYMRRTRTQRKDENWIMAGEMHMQTNYILPKSEWLSTHKYGTTKVENGETIADHWYSKTADQLCWTAGEEMYKEAANDIIELIEKDPTKTYFGVGQADSLLFCDCERCEKAKADWALNDAGLQMYFINRVAYYVNTWVAENCPERNIRLVIFAYYATEEPAVKKDENGKWVAYSEKTSFVYDNIDIYFAPIGTDYSKSLTAVENEDVYQNLQKWSDLLDGRKNTFMLYTYDTNFHYYFYNFNNFDTFGIQALEYSAAGVDYIHSQGANNTNQPTFQEMRYFVESQMLWDTSRNYDELVNEFMEHFYKDAKEEIREYYDLTRMRYEQAIVLDGRNITTIYSSIGEKTIWTEGVVGAFDNIFERAYAKIEHYKTENSAMYEKLYNRIKELELTVIYTKLANYTNNYTQAEINSLVEEFNRYVAKFDINLVRENGSSTLGLFDSYKK